jgi:uncharacterized protein (DUF885 family)
MRLCALLTLLPVVSLAGCALQAPDSDQASARFRTELEEDWKFWMAAYPELATALGYPGHDARWTDYSAEAIVARADYLKRSVERLAAIDRAGLGAEDQSGYDLYRDLLQTAIAGLEFHNDALPLRGVVPHNLRMPLNQLEGVALDIPRTISLMPRATRDDYENIVTRLQTVGALVDQTIALMEQGLAEGLTPPRVTLRDVPGQVRAQVVDDPQRSPMLEAFSNWPASIPERERADFIERATAAYREQVKPAFERLHQFLVSRYIPACRDSIAISALPNGASMYSYNVKWHVTTGDTPERIHETGLTELRRIRSEMDAIAATTGFRGSSDDFKRFLRENPKFFFSDAASLLTAYRDVAKRAEPRLAALFGRLPQTPYGVEPVPDASAPSQTTAYYEPGSFAAGRPANMFANTYKLDSRPSWEITALTLHEAVPGHHLQVALAQELTGLPEFRKNSSYTAFVEGWALYAESLGDEMGLYKDPYAKFGQLTYDAWRAVRLVVDTGLHAMGWTREQAIDFFRANTAKTDQDIVVEVDRYIVWPGQALGYKMGQLKIRELRTRAERELGPRFDIRQFHDAVLSQGAVPMDVLERQVDNWVARARGQ